MRKIILQLHLWVGLTVGLLLVALGVSGALLVFEDQIDRSLNPSLGWVKPDGKTLPLSELKQSAEHAHPGFHVAGFVISNRDNSSYAIDMEPKSGDGIEIAINQHTGEVLGTWNDDRFIRKLHGFHTHLLAGKIGNTIVGWGGGVFLLLLSVTGLILWWPQKVSVFRWETSGTKFQYDLHNTIGIYLSVFLLIFAVTGMFIHWERETSIWASRVSHYPARERAPKITAAAGVTPLTPERLISAAEAAAPGARATVIQLQADAEVPALVIMKFPEDHTPIGRTRLYLDPYTGKVLLLASSRNMPAAVNYVQMVNRAIHTGDIFGWPTRILAAVISLVLPVLAISGPLIWWNRKKAVRRSKPKNATAALGSRSDSGYSRV